jgi:hypothetical protein
MSAFISSSSYGQPAPFAGQQLSNAPLPPSTSSVLGKKREADEEVDVGFGGESQQTMMAMSQESSAASSSTMTAAAAAPAFKRRLVGSVCATSEKPAS